MYSYMEVGAEQRDGLLILNKLYIIYIFSLTDMGLTRHKILIDIGCGIFAYMSRLVLMERRNDGEIKKMQADPINWKCI